MNLYGGPDDLITLHIEIGERPASYSPDIHIYRLAEYDPVSDSYIYCGDFDWYELRDIKDIEEVANKIKYKEYFKYMKLVESYIFFDNIVPFRTVTFNGETEKTITDLVCGVYLISMDRIPIGGGEYLYPIPKIFISAWGGKYYTEGYAEMVFSDYEIY